MKKIILIISIIATITLSGCSFGKTVTITIPKDFVGENVTQEKLNEEITGKDFKSAILNDDGSVTYEMTPNTHKKVMAETKESIEKSLDEIENSTDYPNVSEITHNDNFSKYTVVTKSNEVGLDLAFLPIGICMYSGIYNSFNGTEVDNVQIDFVNEQSGEIIHSWNSEDLPQE